MNLKKITCRALVLSMFALSIQTARAGMIGAEQAAPATAQADRTLVLDALARSETVAQLQAQGIDPQQARDRVAAMNEQEVSQLAQDIRSAPAGADATWWVVTVVVIAVVWYFFFRR